MNGTRSGVSTFGAGAGGGGGIPKKQPHQSTSASPNGQQQQPQKSIIEIYTDWANHYLEKLKNRHKIKDLQTELADGLALADVIEAVTGQKVPDIVRKPKSSSQMEANIQASLTYLLARGVAVQDIQPKEVRDGNLKAILGLFFQLSRYKQQQKLMLQQQQQSSPMKKPNPTNCDHVNLNSPHHAARTTTPRIPSVPPSPSKGNTSTPNSCIPSPSRRLYSNGAPSNIPTTPNRSMLPAPKVGRSSGANPSLSRLPPTGGNPSNLGSSGMKSNMQFQQYHPNSGIQVGSRQTQQIRGLGKRTSSSSGFSSGRSVSSGVSCESSSVSTLSSDTNFPSPSALRRIHESPSAANTATAQHASRAPKPPSIPPPQQKSSISGIKRFSKATAPASSPSKSTDSSITLPGAVSKTQSTNIINRGSSSPNRSPKLARAAAAVVAGNTEMKDYGPIDAHQIENYPPHAFNKSTSNGAAKNSSLVKPMFGSNSSVSRIPNPNIGSSSSLAGQSNQSLTASPSPSKMPQPGVARSKSNLTSASGITGRQIPSLATGMAARSTNSAMTNIGSKIPPPTNVATTSKMSSLPQPANHTLPQGCSVKPLINDSEPGTKDQEKEDLEMKEDPCQANSTIQATTSENDEATAMMTASFHSRTCSLPRQKRLGREDGSPGPPSGANVAVVSPMPTTKTPKQLKTQNKTKNELQNNENLIGSKDLQQGKSCCSNVHLIDTLYEVTL